MKTSRQKESFSRACYFFILVALLNLLAVFQIDSKILIAYFSYLYK